MNRKPVLKTDWKQPKEEKAGLQQHLAETPQQCDLQVETAYLGTEVLIPASSLLSELPDAAELSCCSSWLSQVKSTALLSLSIPDDDTKQLSSCHTSN